MNNEHKEKLPSSTLTDYDILGITAQATDEEIRSAYKKMVLQHHPDKVGNTLESNNAFIKIRDAYEKIKKERGPNKIQLNPSPKKGAKRKTHSTSSSTPFPKAKNSKTFKDFDETSREQSFYDLCGNQKTVKANIKDIVRYIQEKAENCCDIVFRGKNIFIMALTMDFRYFRDIYNALLSYNLNHPKQALPTESILFGHNPISLLVYQGRKNDKNLYDKYLILQNLLGKEACEMFVEKSINLAKQFLDENTFILKTQHLLSIFTAVQMQPVSERIKILMGKYMYSKSEKKETPKETLPRVNLTGPPFAFGTAHYSPQGVFADAPIATTHPPFNFQGHTMGSSSSILDRYADLRKLPTAPVDNKPGQPYSSSFFSHPHHTAPSNVSTPFVFSPLFNVNNFTNPEAKSPSVLNPILPLINNIIASQRNEQILRMMAESLILSSGAREQPLPASGIPVTEFVSGTEVLNKR